MISVQEIEKIAGLARLTLAEEEKFRFKKDLSLILDYIEKLKELPVEEVEPTTAGSEVLNVMRPDDEVVDGDGAGDTEPAGEVVKAMLSQAPDQQDGFIKVQAILKNRT